jgi:hypothetical protein
MLTTYPVRAPYPEAGLWKIRDARPPMGLPCRFMRVVRRVGAAAVAVAFAALLGGCAPQVQPPPPKPSPSSSPVFASDEEALAAATKAYDAYLKVSDQIAQDGGSNPNRISSLVTKEWLPQELNGFSEIAKAGRHQVGSSTFQPLTLEQIGQGNSRIAIVSAYVCLNVAGIKFVNEKGEDFTPSNQPESIPFEVEFQGAGPGLTQLLLSRTSQWSGSGIC